MLLFVQYFVVLLFLSYNTYIVAKKEKSGRMFICVLCVKDTPKENIIQHIYIVLFFINYIQLYMLLLAHIAVTTVNLSVR